MSWHSVEETKKRSSCQNCSVFPVRLCDCAIVACHLFGLFRVCMKTGSGEVCS